jgi:hypothetical protein
MRVQGQVQRPRAGGRLIPHQHQLPPLLKEARPRRRRGACWNGAGTSVSPRARPANAATTFQRSSKSRRGCIRTPHSGMGFNQLSHCPVYFARTHGGAKDVHDVAYLTFERIRPTVRSARHVPHHIKACTSSRTSTPFEMALKTDAPWQLFLFSGIASCTGEPRVMETITRSRNAASSNSTLTVRRAVSTLSDPRSRAVDCSH